MTQEESQLASLIARIIELRGIQIKISPAWIATEAMQELDPRRRSVPLVYLGCHLELRQIAREQLRKRYEDRDEQDASTDQHDLFPELQKRYPAARAKKADDPEYVLLEHLTEVDVAYNVSRLRGEARAKLKHADALEAWWRRRLRRRA